MNLQVSERETEEIIKAAKGCLDLDGDFVELGCYQGETSLLLGRLKPKKLWLYDSFAGLPEKSSEDASSAGDAFQAGALLASKNEVILKFKKAGLPIPRVKKAFFEDLGEGDLPERIAFAFLDGDLYKSIKTSLKLVENKMVDDGVIIVHDYNNPQLPGVAKAVGEWKRRINLSSQQYQFAQIGSLAVFHKLPGRH